METNENSNERKKMGLFTRITMILVISVIYGSVGLFLFYANKFLFAFYAVALFISVCNNFDGFIYEPPKK